VTSTTLQQTCPHCGSYEITIVHGDKQVCQDCGFVIAQSEKLTRNQGTNYTLDSTRDDTSDEDWTKIVSPKDSSESQLVELITQAESVVQELEGDRQDCVHAAEIVTEAWEQGYFHGRSSKVCVGAIVYVMFRQAQRPRPFGIVAETCAVSTKQLRSAYRSLGLKYSISGGVIETSLYVPFLATQLSLNECVQKKAQSLIESVPEVAGNPSAVAVASLYISAKSEDYAITLAEAGRAAGVTKETVWAKTKNFSEIR
jgi:transcription initiation factor TFIIIB Brf1 subunit/transcription initiation factor TFIIB